MINICVVTGSRAEYGLLKNIITEIHSDNKLNLILFVTGTHMEQKYNYTYKNIERDNITINEKIYMNLTGDTPKHILIGMSNELKLLADAFDKYNIQLVLILGDRYEILVVAQAALIYNIPIGHLCGGDITKGAYDNAIRNAITKMAKYHFVTCQTSYNNIIKMNENKTNIFLVGNPGLHNITTFIPDNKELFFNKMKIVNNIYNIIVVYHPETLLSKQKNEFNCNILMDSLINIPNFDKTNIIFIETNADNYNNYIFEKIQDLKLNYKNIYSFTSLLQKDYFNLIYYSNIFIGNSSSGIYEVPLFKKITLNIGKRQLGRECGKSIIHINYNKKDIIKAIESNITNYNVSLEDYPYKIMNTSKEIIYIIKQLFQIS